MVKIWNVTNHCKAILCMVLSGSQLTGLTHCWAPHQQKQKFASACVCKVTFKHFPQPLRSHMQRFETLTQILTPTPLSAQSFWRRGVPDVFWGWNPDILLLKGPHAKFQNPKTTFENQTPPSCPPKYTIVRGEGEIHDIFLGVD